MFNECLYIWYRHGYALCSIFRPEYTISSVCSFIKVLIYMWKSLSGHLQEFKDNGLVQLGNPKSGRGRLREWSQGELPLY